MTGGVIVLFVVITKSSARCVFDSLLHLGRVKGTVYYITTKRRQRTAEQGHTAVFKKSVWGLVLHLSDQWIHKCLPPLALAGSSQTKAGCVPVPLTSTPYLHGSLPSAPALQNQACKNREKGLGPQLTTLQQCISATL